ncbi:MAG: tRNA lysidine(34) synthetase TilS [Pseudomonadota bacterium]
MMPRGPEPVPDCTDLVARLRHCLDRMLSECPDVDRFIVAFSGGLDSTVLLHVCTLLGRLPGSCLAARQLEAIHIDHGLSPSSLQWKHHCQQQCDAFSVPLVTRTVQIGEQSQQGRGGKVPEARARKARYEAFAERLGSRDVLLQAHHQDDQAETVLLRLMRGTGPAGLAGMPAQRRLGQGRLLRPFLDVPGSQLEHHAREAGLSWVEDESNLDQRMDRNFLRHRVAPVLAERWPAWRNGVILAARHSAVSARMDDELARQDLVRLRSGTLPFIPEERQLDGRELVKLTRERQWNVLRFWIHEAIGVRVGEAVLRRVTGELLTARADARPEVSVSGFMIRRHRDRLCLCAPLHRVDAAWSAYWRPEREGEQLSLPDNGVLVARHANGKGLPTDCVYGIRYRRRGDKCELSGRPRRALNRLLQEYSIPEWWRDRLPLVTINDEPAWLPVIGICSTVTGPATGTGWDFEWLPPGTAAESDCGQ